MTLIHLLKIRDVHFDRSDSGGLFFSMSPGRWVHLRPISTMVTGLEGVPFETWLWLRLLVGPLCEYAVAHGGHLPPDGQAVHLVLRAAHLAGIPHDQIQDLRPDPLVTWDGEPPLTPTLR